MARFRKRSFRSRRRGSAGRRRGRGRSGGRRTMVIGSRM